jgi:hypothetical protein
VDLLAVITSPEDRVTKIDANLKLSMLVTCMARAAEVLESAYINVS